MYVNLYKYYQEILNKMSRKELADFLFINTGTIGRWELKKEVPFDYFNDFDYLLNGKLSNEIKNENNFETHDQYFTKSSVAKELIELTKRELSKLKIDEKKYKYIEPSAGNLGFYNNLPKDRRIGIDLEPTNKEIIESNYFDFKPKNKNNIVIGNPPFGLRGNLALRFMRHSYEFSDVIAFILPPLFDSTGKGTPMSRIEGFNLVYSKPLKNPVFEYPNGKNVDVKTIFQIWIKDTLTKKDIRKNREIDLSKFLDLYSVSIGKEKSSNRNIKMIGECDFYLPSTTFKEIKLVKEFSELPHKRGYGIYIKKDKKKVSSIIKSINWQDKSFKSTNYANNLRFEIIKKAISDGGLKNE